MQRVTEEIAFSKGSWDDERKAKITELFDSLAPEWHTRSGEARLAPTRDALERGLAKRGGVAVEIGSGTGIQTPPLAEHFGFVVSVDISAQMLALTPGRDSVALLRADASILPLKDASADAIVCVNAFLFPDEYARVLRRGGTLVFVSTSGDVTPIYLPAEKVVASLSAALGEVEATSSCYEWGCWTTVRAT